MPTKTKKKRNDASLKREQSPLSPINFVLMAVCGVLIIVGFLLMTGAPSTTEYNPDIFSTRRIIIGPGIALVGFVAMAYAIMYRPKSKKGGEESQSKEEE